MEGPSEAELADGRDCLMRGIYAYLQEVDAYHAVCRRHEGKAAILTRGSDLEVSRFFDGDRNVTGHLQSALRRLPRWQTGRRRQAGDSARVGKGDEGNAEVAGWPDQSSLVSCSVIWEDRRFLVQVRSVPPLPIVQVDLIVPPREGDLPELPVRRVADALRCHELLVPECVARPLLPPSDHGMPLLGIRDYLSRAMPPTLYASQCI